MRFFGHRGEIADPQKFFREQEYIVCRGALDDNAISGLVDLYQTDVTTSSCYYMRQSTHWERHQMTPYGGVSNGFLNPHCYEKGARGKFADEILKLLSTPAVRETLALISGKSVDFTLYQTIFFDQNTTSPHQDWCFLRLSAKRAFDRGVGCARRYPPRGHPLLCLSGDPPFHATCQL